MSGGCLLFRHGGQQRGVGDRRDRERRLLDKGKVASEGAAVGRPYLLFVGAIHLRCTGRSEGWLTSSNRLRLVGRLEDKA